MIVLDEELQGLGVEAAIAGWYRGRVLLIKALRPGTVIKDEAIPVLLRRVRQSTFITINHSDFWRRTAAEKSFCLVCLKLTADQAGEISPWLRRLFRLPAFKTKSPDGQSCSSQLPKYPVLQRWRTSDSSPWMVGRRTCTAARVKL